MPIPDFAVECIQNKCIAENIYELRFAKPEGFNYKPGQFVMVDVPAQDDAADIQPRAYSIASTNTEQHITLAIRIKEGGRAGDWILNNLQQGDLVRLQGPLGVFGFNDATQKDYLLICTGAGLAPFRSMVRSTLEGGETRNIDIVYGAYNEEDMLWKQEFEDLAQEYSNFTMHTTLSEGSDAWDGHRGFVQAVVPKVFPDCSQKSVYVCGNPNMAKDVKKHCLEDWSIAKEDFHMEGFI